MSAVLAAMCKRRSIRKYTGDNVTAEQIEAVLQAGLLAPSIQDRGPCWFVVVRNRELLERLSRAKRAGAGMLADADFAKVSYR